jgi:hypothetical protein
LRPLRRIARAIGILEPRPRELLAEAHSLEASGKYADAAALFAQLADEAFQRGMPDRAGNLNLQAARCYASGGDSASALARARAGLRLLVQAEREHRAAVACRQAIEGFRARGFKQEADTLAREFPDLVEATEEELDEEGAPTAAAERRGHLPPKCPSCGGPLRAADVDWIDDLTAECPYCGSGVRAEMR